MVKLSGILAAEAARLKRKWYEDFESERDFFEWLADVETFLRASCHAPGCELPHCCPYEHEACSTGLNFGTSILWSIAQDVSELRFNKDSFKTVMRAIYEIRILVETFHRHYDQDDLMEILWELFSFRFERLFKQYAGIKEESGRPCAEQKPGVGLEGRRMQGQGRPFSSLEKISWIRKLPLIGKLLSR